MENLQLTIPLPGAEPALLTLPRPLTAQTLNCLAAELPGRLQMLRRELGDGSDGAGAIEYESWRLFLAPVRQ